MKHFTKYVPSHAYIPGKSERHPEDCFDEFKVCDSSPFPGKLCETTAWKMGLNFLQGEYYWEAHELLESVWLACSHNSAEKLFVQAVIQIANSGLKRKMGMDEAARKLNRHSNKLASEAFLRTNGNIFGYSLADWPTLRKLNGL